jgi:hypothetical protein
MQKEINMERMQFGQEANQVLQAAPEPVDRPRHYDVELALCRVSAERIKGGALVATLCAADALILVAVTSSFQRPRTETLVVFRFMTASRSLLRTCSTVQVRSFVARMGCPTSGPSGLTTHQRAAESRMPLPELVSVLALPISRRMAADTLGRHGTILRGRISSPSTPFSIRRAPFANQLSIL